MAFLIIRVQIYGTNWIVFALFIKLIVAILLIDFFIFASFYGLLKGFWTGYTCWSQLKGYTLSSLNFFFCFGFLGYLILSCFTYLCMFLFFWISIFEIFIDAFYEFLSSFFSLMRVFLMTLFELGHPFKILHILAYVLFIFLGNFRVHLLL